VPPTCLAGSRHACLELATVHLLACWISRIFDMAYGARGRRPDQQPVPAACAGSLLLQCSSLLFQCSSLLLQCSSLLFLMPVLAWCVLRDDRAKTPHDVPDGFYPIRRCQFLQVSFEYDRSFSTLEG
jgi:hypothetical protein